MHACLFLPFPPSVNNLFVNSRRTGGRFPSKNYKAWQEEAARALVRQAVAPLVGPVNLTFTFGRPDKRRRDVFNYAKAPADFLVKHRILDDDRLVVRGTVQWSAHVIAVRTENEHAGGP